ncbi:MAG: PAS domain S-box protein [Desulfatibacillum sp.]|nr:PAS domain S-box protein [Desulfatibacillum sp.]
MINPFFFNTSISRKFAGALAGVMIAILAVFTLLLVAINANNTRNQLESSLQSTADLAQLSLANALWHFNDSYVTDFLESIFLSDDIVFAEVVTEKRVVSQKARLQFTDKPFAFFKSSSDYLTLSKEIYYKDKQVGRIRLAFSTKKIRRAAYKEARAAFALMVLVLIAISLTTGLLSRKFVFAPLSRLKQSAERIAAGNLDEPIAMDSADEIGEFSGALDSMRISISESMEKLRQADVVKAAKERLEIEIKERRRAESAIREQRDRAQNYLDIAGVIIVALDSVGRVTLINRKGCEVLGLSESEIVGKNWLETFVAEDEKTRIENVFSQIIQENVPDLGYVENRIKTAYGEPRYVAWHNTVLTDAQNRVIGTLSSGEDIAERKQAEIALLDSEARYRLLADNIEDCIWLMDMDFAFSYINPAVYRMMGYTVEEWVGSNLQDHCDEKNFFDMAGVVITALENLPDNSGIVFEADMQKKNGDPIRVEITGRVLLDEDGTPVGLQGVTRDITLRHQMEHQLRQAQKIEAIGRLAGGVAHDFNNMLGVILGHAEMAMSRIDSNLPIQEDLHEIQHAAQRSADLTRQLLAFARRQTIQPRLLDLNDTVSGMLKMLKRLIGENITLEWKPEPELWTVKMDPSQVDQVLANLSINARDAIAGVGNLFIETRNVVFDEAYCSAHADFVPGEYVMLAVSDNGAGMDKETLEHLFEPFFTTKGMEDGTGLGLATIYGMVKQNQGFINVYSEPGQGTSFKIYLPRVMEDASVLKAGAEPEPAQGKETVLVVEDESAILKLAKSILERYGYHVLASGSPGEALDLAERHEGPIHLLVTDVVMPEMNGKDLKDRIEGQRPDIKVLFMSGYTANVIAHHGVVDEDVNFIQKPFAVKAMAAAVRKALDKP